MITTFTITGSNVLANSVEVIGNLEGNAAGGPYKIPLRIVYPTGGSPVLRRAVIEPWNNVFVERFTATGTTIIDIAYHVLGIPYLVEERGYTYVEHEWNKLMIDGQVAAGISPRHTANLFFGALPFPVDPTLVISAATDGYEIMADVSTFTRNPTAYNAFAGLPSPSPSDKAFSFGASQTGMLLRDFAMNSRNSSLGAGFPNGLVYEGTFAGLPGSQVRTLVNVPALGFYVYDAVPGPTPASEGAFLNMNSETDMFMFQGILARDAAPPPHYAFYEIAGVAHNSGEFGPFIRPVQNTRLAGPFFRAMLENLRSFVDLGIAFPPPQVLEGSAATRDQPLFPNNAPITGFAQVAGFTVNTYVGVPSPEDGNFLGGIRPPHLLTRLPNGSCVGAPLGTYRGTLALTLDYPDNSLPNAIQIMPSPPGTLIGTESLIMNAGFFAAWEPALINRWYRDACEYVTQVEAGANYALANRWILPADRDAYVAEAASFTTQELLDMGLRRLVPPPPPTC